MGQPFPFEENDVKCIYCGFPCIAHLKNEKEQEIHCEDKLGQGHMERSGG